MKPTSAEINEELKAGPLADLAEPLGKGIADLNQLAKEIGPAALDPKIWGDGGAAFLWEDLLSLEDAAAAAHESLKSLDAEGQVKLLLKLVLFWGKLRGVRVMLEKDEYRVMKAVKERSGTIAEVARRLGSSDAEITLVVNALKTKPYRETIMLLEEKNGILSTRF